MITQQGLGVDLLLADHVIAYWYRNSCSM